jgi:hypothetical protein
MAKVDEISKDGDKQIVPTIVARLVYGLSPTAKSGIEKRRKAKGDPAFLQNICSLQITASQRKTDLPDARFFSTKQGFLFETSDIAFLLLSRHRDDLELEA